MITPDPANTAFPYAPINEPVWGTPRDEQAALLRTPLAGIDLGTYDERILDVVLGKRDFADTEGIRAGLQYVKDFIQGLEFKDEQS